MRTHDDDDDADDDEHRCACCVSRTHVCEQPARVQQEGRELEDVTVARDHHDVAVGVELGQHGGARVVAHRVVGQRDGGVVDSDEHVALLPAVKVHVEVRANVSKT